MNYQNQIDIVNETMQQCPGSKATWSISYAKGNKKWLQAGWERDDRKGLKSRLQSVINNYQPDAVKVIINPKLKNHNAQEHIIDITNNIDFSNNSNFEKKHEQNKSSDNGLNGAAFGGLGALQVENLNKNFEIKLLEKDKERFLEEKAELQNKIKDLEAENDALYTEISTTKTSLADSKWMPVLGAIAGKKLLGDDFDMGAMMGLVSDVGTTAEDNANVQKELAEKQSGLSSSNENNDSKPIRLIRLYLKNLESSNADGFKKVVTILTKFESDPSLINTVVELLNS